MRARKNTTAYSKLRRKICAQLLMLMAAAVVIIFIIYSLVWRGRMGDWIVAFLQKVLSLDRADALNIYQQVFRNNSAEIMLAAVILCFILMFWVSISWFMGYFREVELGVDLLINEDNKEITLSPELIPMEQKLNVVRETLERRQLETKLAEERKNNLVMYLAHDIRTPLTSVIGYLSLLDEAWDMPEGQRKKYIHIALEKSYRLEQLINEFFEITRYNFQQMVLEKEQIDLYYMLIQLMDEFYPILSERGNTVLLRADENIKVSGDSIKLARVFNNILKNATAYSYSDTQIEIFAEVKEETVEIRIQNCGKTIPKEKLLVIFDKFYRMDGARTSDTGGAGLGLSIAKEIVTLHGGTISAESEEEHTVFTIELPL